MSTTGLAVFDETLQLTNEWLRDVMNWLDTDDRRFAYRALRAVLHALRDHLEPELAAHLGAQLPMLVRGFYYEGWSPSRVPVHERRLDQFYDRVRAEMRDHSDFDAARATDAVLVLLVARISEGEIRKVASALPKEVQAMWPLPS